MSAAGLIRALDALPPGPLTPDRVAAIRAALTEHCPGWEHDPDPVSERAAYKRAWARRRRERAAREAA